MNLECCGCDVKKFYEDDMMILIGQGGSVRNFKKMKRAIKISILFNVLGR